MMSSSSPHASASKPIQSAFLSILISLLVIIGAVGGFVIGRHTSRDAYVDKVSALLATETNGMNLYEVLGKGMDDPLTAEALAELYDVPVQDRDALAKRLQTIAWVPPYRPVPFVGHMARPVLGEDLHINFLGFRDERQSYVAKPDHTVRIFITGGSTAWGTGASSQKKTISHVLEQILNERLSRVTGFRYEVINTAFPGWSTTQEKILIQQRLADMHPDAVIMLSGNNDIHWALNGRDIRWFYSYMDQNYLTLFNELHKSNGHPERALGLPFASRPVECSDLGQTTAENVTDAAVAANRGKARLVFVLQPNIVSTGKRLTKYEQRIFSAQNRSYWDACYQVLRETLAKISGQNYQMVDLSRSLGEVNEDTELFVDSYHFADRGQRLIAEALADQIDWRSLVPRTVIAPGNMELPTIVSLEPNAWEAGKPFNEQGGVSTLRLVPGRNNKNLLVVFDQSVVHSTIGGDAITASIPASLYAKKGNHAVYIVDGMTGQASQPAVFETR
jgi:lysophospholipase L1-like esterase